MDKTLNRLGPLPGDPTKAELVARMIRVDHAGEFGAKRIYAGQIAVLGDSEDDTAQRKAALPTPWTQRHSFRSTRCLSA